MGAERPITGYMPRSFPGRAVFVLLVSLCFAEQRWASAAVGAVRWPDVTAVSLSLAAGDEVEVLATDGELVRVRKGVDFGWVPATSLTDVAPPPPSPPLDGGFELDGFELSPASPGDAESLPE